jgi:hypothetical protein
MPTETAKNQEEQIMKFSDFLHTGPERAGFYRNPKSAEEEAKVIKKNAANGPRRPTESPAEARARVDQKIKQQRTLLLKKLNDQE